MGIVVLFDFRGPPKAWSDRLKIRPWYSTNKPKGSPYGQNPGCGQEIISLENKTRYKKIKIYDEHQIMRSYNFKEIQNITMFGLAK